MEYKLINHDDSAEVAISGRLTFAEHDQCREIIDRLGEFSGSHQIIDLREVKFIDSAGLGWLLLLRENAEKTGRSITLRIPDQGQVQHMLEVSRFEELIPIEC